MYKESALITYYALTPLHMGAGSSVSYIDLPIQRERHTSFPMMAASGIKGVFRSLAERKWKEKEKVNSIFGPEDGEEEYSSSIAFTDARILLYPIRSIKNIFAWITCPYVLKRFKEDLKSLGKNDCGFEIPEIDDERILVPESTRLKIDSQNRIGLEEFVFEIQTESSINEILKLLENYIPNVETKNALKERFAIVSDNVFTDLVNYAVEVRTRIKIDQTTGTAQSGALFTVEMVPSEAVFYSLMFISLRRNGMVKGEDLRKLAEDSILQFGGDETIGIGFMRVKVNLGS